MGAGGGQLLDPKVATAETVLVDRNLEALAEPNIVSARNGAPGCVRSIAADFNDVEVRGDVVYFEFCLHEMDDPQKAIDHARTLAPDVVVFEHSPGSDWVFYAAEEEQVYRSAQALAQAPVKSQQNVYAEQVFKDHAELVAKLSTQGERALQRAIRFAGETNIVIPMKCTLVLL